MINGEVLRQFALKGLVISEEAAVDARLVQSASRPISTHGLHRLREERRLEGRLTTMVIL